MPDNTQNIEWDIFDTPAPYESTIQLMEDRVAQIKTGQSPESIWLLEHPPLYTAGTSAHDNDMLTPQFPVYKTGRGGQYTYHGPGQVIAYVMMNLKKRQQAPDIKRYVWCLEEWIIRTLAQIGIDGYRISGRVGIWVKDGVSDAKIAAIGVRVRHWVTYHGISINLNPDLSHFDNIVPCGISDAGVTSIEKLAIEIERKTLHKLLQETFKQIDPLLNQSCR